MKTYWHFILITAHIIIVFGISLEPNSCYWCVQTGQTWSFELSKCGQGYTLYTPENCTSLQIMDGIVSLGKHKYTDVSKYNNTPVQINFSLPFEGQDQQRVVSLQITNAQSYLNLRIKVQCDESQVTGFVLRPKLQSNLEPNLSYSKTYNFACGETNIISSFEAFVVILIQNSGSSNLVLEYD